MTSMLFVYIFLLATLIHNGYQRSQEKFGLGTVCKNQYIYTNSTNMSWLNPTPNRFHAHYEPNTQFYEYHQVVLFSCPRGMVFKGTNLQRGQSTCLEKAMWSREWPMCKGRTCDRLRIKNAIVDDEDKALPPGTVVNIKCHHGYHLVGGNQSVCLEDLNWSVHRRGCLTLKKYKDYCRSIQREFKMTDGGEAMCVGDIHGVSNTSVTSERFILGATIPFGVLVVIMFIISVLYVRKLRSYRSRSLRATVRFQNIDHTIDLMLPSYEDTIKNTPTTPPPTFEESEAMVGWNTNQVREDGVDEPTFSNDRSTNYDPPPYEE